MTKWEERCPDFWVRECGLFYIEAFNLGQGWEWAVRMNCDCIFTVTEDMDCKSHSLQEAMAAAEAMFSKLLEEHLQFRNPVPRTDVV